MQKLRPEIYEIDAKFERSRNRHKTRSYLIKELARYNLKIETLQSRNKNTKPQIPIRSRFEKNETNAPEGH